MHLSNTQVMEIGPEPGRSGKRKAAPKACSLLLRIEYSKKMP